MIRSLTIGLPINTMSQSKLETVSKRMLTVSGDILRKAQIPPRTVRYTLPPVGIEGETEGLIISMARFVDGLANDTGVRWFCLPLDLLTAGNKTERLSVALDIISRYPKLFLNLMVADQERLSLPAINDTATLISHISKKSNNGFDNFRVGASCGCPPNAPFFPFSRHAGDSVAFSFALETTGIALDLANELGSTPHIDSFRDKLVDKLAAFLIEIQAIGECIEHDTGCEFRGIDGSLAPFPDGRMSVAALIEKLLGAPLGSHGSVFVTAILTDAIRTAFKISGALPVGFNGVMFSLLEDDGLASANSRRLITLDGLVALSAVCACGIDMVPVPGNSFPEEIASVLVDIASLSLTLNKPLGVRILPIPGRSSNEFTQFNLDFLCDSRVMGLSTTDRCLVSREHTLGMLSPLRCIPETEDVKS